MESTSKIDLHRTRHEDVNSEVIRFIERYWNSGKELEIITGHSNRMKNLVTEVLEEYKLEWQVGRKFDVNKGYIVIKLN
jgi:uncharacterized protein YggU (UPF0235/DUF167 family)